MEAEIIQERTQLPCEEVKRLVLLAQQGDLEARNRIVEDSCWIIRAVNQKYGNTEDGFQQGFLGLISAIDKYKVGEKTKFSTYAYFWIEQKIGRYVSKDTYRASHHLIYLFKEMKKFKGTQEEFFKKKGLNEKTIGALRQMGINKELEFTEIYGVRDLSILEEIDRFILRDYLEDIMSQHCTPKEKYILEKIFFSKNKKGMDELSKEFKCTKSYINMEKNRILCKIRSALL